MQRKPPGVKWLPGGSKCSSQPSAEKLQTPFGSSLSAAPASSDSINGTQRIGLSKGGLEWGQLRVSHRIWTSAASTPESRGETPERPDKACKAPHPPTPQRALEISQIIQKIIWENPTLRPGSCRAKLEGPGAQTPHKASRGQPLTTGSPRLTVTCLVTVQSENGD